MKRHAIFQVLVLIACSNLAFCFAQSQRPPEPPEKAADRVTGKMPTVYAIAKDEAVVYGKGIVHENEELENPRVIDLLSDIWYPKGKEGEVYPAVILVHGGGFKGSYKAQKRLWAKFPSLANRLVPKGYAVMSIDYRLQEDYPLSPPTQTNELQLSGRGTRHAFREVHAAVRDTKTALRWLHKYGPEKYNIDPEKIFLVGTSAGACAVVSAGIDEDDYQDDGPKDTTVKDNHPGKTPKPAGIVDIAGLDYFVSDEVFEGKAPGVSWPLEKSDYGPEDPPVMIWHGTADRLVDVKWAHGIHKRCEEAGIPSRLYIIEEGGHVCWGCEYEGKGLVEWMYLFFEDVMAGKLKRKSL